MEFAPGARSKPIFPTGFAGTRLAPDFKTGDDGARHGKRQHTSTAIACSEIHPPEFVVVVHGGAADVVDATRWRVVDERHQVCGDVAGVDRLEAHTLDRK